MAAATPVRSAAFPAEATPIRPDDEALRKGEDKKRMMPALRRRRLLLATPSPQPEKTEHKRQTLAKEKLMLKLSLKASSPEAIQRRLDRVSDDTPRAEIRTAGKAYSSTSADATPVICRAQSAETQVMPSPMASSHAVTLSCTPPLSPIVGHASQTSPMTPRAQIAAIASASLPQEACRRKNDDSVSESEDANLDSTLPQTLADRLFFECSAGGSAEMLVKHLADAGEDASGLVLGTTQIKVTPIAAAAAAGFLDLVQLLLDFGASPDPMSSVQVAPLAAAAENGRVHIASLLLDAGADVEAASFGS